MSIDLIKLKGDIFGGVTTAVIALPISLAFGVASGVGAAAGLYAAIAVGFFAAVFGGTPGLVSGPTAPMAVAMAVVVTHSASSLPEAFTIVMLAGLLQIGFGAFRLGRFIAYTPYSVVSGFLTGIGVIVISMQVLPVLGSPMATDGFHGTVAGLPAALATINSDAIFVAVITLATAVLWPRTLKRVMPDALAALLVGTAAGILIFDQAPTVGTLPSGIPTLQVPVLAGEVLIKMIEPALVLAIIGSIDSLLVALIAGAMTRAQQQSNKELVGQGIANIVSGVFGGLPGAGSPVPTVVNIKAGGRSRLAGILVALLLFAFLFDAGKLVEPIPLAVLAGLLIHIGWHVVDWRFLTRVKQMETPHLVVMSITAVLTVFVDLLSAVAIGLIASGMINAMHTEEIELDSVVSVPLLDLDSDDPFSARTGLLRLAGRFTVASAAKLSHVIGADIREHEVVIFDFSKTEFLDDSAVMVIRELISDASEQKKPCIVMGMSLKIEKSLRGLGALKGIETANYAESLDHARQIADQFLVNKDQHQ